MPTTIGARQGSAPVALQLKAGEVKDARKGVELVVQGPAPTELYSTVEFGMPIMQAAKIALSGAQRRAEAKGA